MEQRLPGCTLQFKFEFESEDGGAEPGAGACGAGGLRRLFWRGLLAVLLVVRVAVGVAVFDLPVLCAVLAAGRGVCLRQRKSYFSAPGIHHHKLSCRSPP